MAKVACSVCEKEMGWLERTKICDGTVCDECISASGLRPYMKTSQMCFTVEQVKKTINGELTPSGPTIYCIGINILYFNRAANTWMNNLWLFSPAHNLADVISYEYIENDVKHSVGRIIGHAAIGALIFGGAGAMIGALIGNKQKRKIKRAKFVVVEQKGSKINELHIPLIGYKDSSITVGSAKHLEFLNIVKGIAEEFDSAMGISENNNSQEEEIASTQLNINADLKTTKATEIMELKLLFDNGIITKEEFEAGKKNILF